MATTIGEIQLVAKIDTSQYEQGAEKVKQANKDIEGSAQATERQSNKSFDGIAKVGLAAIATAAVAAGAAIVKNLGSAVSRVDTLNNFPRVLEAMGSSTADSENAINTLDQKLRGLPTTLQAGAQGVQQFIAAGLDAGSATDIFLGVNNALLATGSSAQDTQIVMEGLQRVISAGGGDASTLQAVLSRMPTVLSAISKETGKSQGELYKLFSEDPSKLLDAIVNLNTKGGAGMASLEEQARQATSGIATSYDNMNTAITRGIGGILDSIGEENISNTLNNIGRAFETVFSVISLGIGFIRSNANIFLPIINGMGTAIGAFIGLATAAYIGVKALVVLRAAMTLLVAHPIILTLSIIAGLIAAIATSAGLNNVQEGLDDSAKSAEDASGGIGGMADGLKEAGSGAKNLAKELAKIDKQIDKTNRDFREQLAELVSNKRQSISELTSQLKEEDSKYQKAYSDRLYQFTQTQNEESLKHQEKTKALQTQIDFLSRYNTAANQRRLSELQFTLARENAEFDKSNTERQVKYDQDAEAERLSYEKRQAELRVRLNNETALLNKHRADVDSIRNVILLDEIDKLKRSRNEQLANLSQQRNDAISNAASTAQGVVGQWSSPKLKTQFDNAGKGLGEAAGRAFVNAMIKEILNLPKRIWEESAPGGAIDRKFDEWFGTNSAAGRAFGRALRAPGYAEGGFTGRGNGSEPAGIVHKGEYVLPQNLVDQSTGLPDLDKLIGSRNMSSSNSQPMVINLKHSKGAMRQAALDTIELVNEVYRSKGIPQIGVQR